jgi:hypothetical protein
MGWMTVYLGGEGAKGLSRAGDDQLWPCDRQTPLHAQGGCAIGHGLSRMGMPVAVGAGDGGEHPTRADLS